MSETTTVKVEGSLTPFQRDCITAALKWIMRIDDRRAMLPASFMDNCDPAPLVRDLRGILAGEDRAQDSDPILETVLKVLNTAFQADPAAMHALCCLRIPCSEELADHPTIQVVTPPLHATAKLQHAVGPIGLINGFVEPLTGKRIAMLFDDTDAQRPFFAGFVVFDPAGKPPVTV